MDPIYLSGALLIGSCFLKYHGRLGRDVRIDANIYDDDFKMISWSVELLIKRVSSS